MCAVVVVGCAVHFFPSFSFPFSVLQIPNRKDERTNEQTKDRKKSQDDVRAWKGKNSMLPNMWSSSQNNVLLLLVYLKNFLSHFELFPAHCLSACLFHSLSLSWDYTCSRFAFGAAVDDVGCCANSSSFYPIWNFCMLFNTHTNCLFKWSFN